MGAILESLIVDMLPSFSDAATWEEGQERLRGRDLAAQSLREPGTNALSHPAAELRRLCDGDPDHPERVVGMVESGPHCRPWGKTRRHFFRRGWR